MGSYGAKRSGTAPGVSTLNAAFYSPYTFSGNVIANGANFGFPSGNYFPAALTGVGFTNQGANDYRLLSSSTYKGKGTDSKDPGVDFTVLSTYTAGSKSGVWPSGLPPLPPVSQPDSLAPAAPASLH